MAKSSAGSRAALEPRAYGIAPVGTTIVLAGVGGTKGAILYDASVPVADVEADLAIVTAGFGYTFALANRQARVLAVVPFASGEITGTAGGVLQQQDSWPNGTVDQTSSSTVAAIEEPEETRGVASGFSRKDACKARMLCPFNGSHILPPEGGSHPTDS